MCIFPSSVFDNYRLCFEIKHFSRLSDDDSVSSSFWIFLAIFLLSWACLVCLWKLNRWKVGRETANKSLITSKTLWKTDFSLLFTVENSEVQSTKKIVVVLSWTKKKEKKKRCKFIDMSLVIEATLWTLSEIQEKRRKVSKLVPSINEFFETWKRQPHFLDFELCSFNFRRKNNRKRE